MKRFIINQNDAGQRIDKFVSKVAPYLPASMMYKCFRNKDIKLNGKRCNYSDRLSESDVIEIYVKDEFFPSADDRHPSAHTFLFSDPDIDVVYEDENILLVNKKVGTIVHEDKKELTNTLINQITHYLYLNGDYDPEKENSFAPALCNRIDRNTSGIVITAKNAESLRILNDKIKTRQIEKKYLCVVHGIPQKKHSTEYAYLWKDSDKNEVHVTLEKENQNSRKIITEYQVLQSKGDSSLVEVTLHTGRTHQIRAHMAFLGYPLFGDSKYGVFRKKQTEHELHQALCSYKLTFRFHGEATALDYLNGKTFQIDTAEFISEHFNP